MSRSRWILTLFLTLSGYQLYRSSTAAVLFKNYGTQRFQFYRLLIFQNPEYEMPSMTIALDLLRQGCRVTTESGEKDDCGADILDGWECVSSLAIPSAQVAEMDGFRLSLGGFNASVTQAAIRFRLQGRSNGRHNWTDVGTPAFRRIREGVRLLGGGMPPPPSATAAAAGTVFDFRGPWPLAMREVCAPGAQGALFAALACCAATGGADALRRAFAMLLAADGLALAVSGVGYLALGQYPEAAYPLCAAAADGALRSLLWGAPRLLRYGLAAYGAALLLLRAAENCGIFADCGAYPTAAAGD